MLILHLKNRQKQTKNKKKINNLISANNSAGSFNFLRDSALLLSRGARRHRMCHGFLFHLLGASVRAEVLMGGRGAGGYGTCGYKW